MVASKKGKPKVKSNDEMVVTGNSSVPVVDSEKENSKIEILNRGGDVITTLIIPKYVAVELGVGLDRCNIRIVVDNV